MKNEIGPIKSTVMKNGVKILLSFFLPLVFSLHGSLVQAQSTHFQSGNSLRNNQLGHYYKMVSFDDQQYQEFAYWSTSSAGSVIEFMNWRVVFPSGYQQSGSTKYPMIVMLHGAGESGREWTNNFKYPSSDPRYDNNDNNLLWGGKEHLDAVNSSPSSARSFPGIVIFPQVSYSGDWEDGWNDGTLNDNGRMAVGIIEYLIANYNVDQYKIYVHGLSAGAKGVWDIASKRPDLFAAMLPMSGVGTDMSVMTDILVTTPLWLFQGGKDTNPSPGYSQQWIDALKSRGGNPRYTLYPNLDHGTWNTAYQEPDFFSWMRSQDKRNIYVFGETTSLDETPSIKLGISAGFLAYQWMLNGTEIPGANSRFYTATQPGTYAVKFKRRTDDVVDQSFNVKLTGTQGPPSPDLTNGLYFTYYEYDDDVNSLSSFDFTRPATLVGNVNNFYTSLSKRPAYFVITYDGAINIPTAGTYRFYTKSEDGSNLYINGNQVVNNDGQHESKVESNTYSFSAAGKFPIRVTFFNQTGNQNLSVAYNAGTTNNFSLANMIADVDLFLPSKALKSGRIMSTDAELANEQDTLTIKNYGTDVRAFPNPFRGYIHVWFMKDVSRALPPIRLVNVVTGTIIKELTADVYEHETVIDCNDVAAGLYVLMVGEQRFKMVKRN